MINDVRDVIINVSKETRMTNFDKCVIGNDGENLQGKLIFKFEDSFVSGIGRLEYSINDELNYLLLDKKDDMYYIPIKNVITKTGSIYMQLVITEESNENGIPVFKSNKFYLYIGDSINAVEEAPEGYDLWIDTANAKLIELDEAMEAIKCIGTELCEKIDKKLSDIDGTISVATAVMSDMQQLQERVTEDEIIRSNSEVSRLAEETMRNTNESARVENENIRSINESTRVENEEERVKNEKERVSNEAIREQVFSKYEDTIKELQDRLDKFESYNYLVLEGSDN